LKPECLGTFLESSRQLISHTPAHFTRAASSIDRKRFDFLFEYYREHAKEEAGHDQWAESDLHHLKFEGKINAVPATRELVSHIEKTIDADPVNYMAHVYFAESIAIVAGPPMAEGVVRKCGFDPSVLSVVTKHATLDVDHLAHDREILTKICAIDGAYAETLTAAFVKSMSLYFRMCQQCAL
jgi:hypothetical protein